MLHMNRSGLKLQPAKMLSRSKTSEKGLLYCVSEGDLASLPSPSYLQAAAS